MTQMKDKSYTETRYLLQHRSGYFHIHVSELKTLIADNNMQVCKA